VDRASWPDVERVLSEAILLPREERAARLAELCGNDLVLQSEVESLLRAHDDANSFLQGTALSEPGEHLDLGGKRVGQYLMREPLGAGGMGTVYRAERTDGRFQKEVAVKVAFAALHSPELRRRFSSEQQILAMMEHANITRLLDAGVTAEGFPYIIMEYVEGVPISEYCREKKPGLRERIALFREVCSAVEYAHQHQIVHRDLKPANILVTNDGTAKLMDFGIAKMLDEWRTAETERRHSALIPMTLDYASPEQTRGEAIGPATDIYSLGVVLYEMVAEQLPYQIGGLPLHESMRVICEAEPEPPTSALRRRYELAGAENVEFGEFSETLDQIVGKAMKKAPGERYLSVRDLADDLAALLDANAGYAARGALSQPPETASVLSKVAEAGQTRFHFGNFEADLVSSELFHKGKRVKLQMQPFRVLAMLLRSAGQMVTRESLRNALWPTDTFVDFEAGLNTAIRKLRFVLRDSADRPCYVETLPLRGYRMIARVRNVRRPHQKIDSIAVLPFVAPGRRRDTKYLSHSITERLISALSEFPALQRVIAQSSVWSYKGRALDLREVGQALNVRAILTGKVILRAETVQITAELVDSLDLRYIWGDSYKCSLAEVSILQDRIIGEIAAALKLKNWHRPKFTKSNRPRDIGAYRLFLQGRYWWNKRPSRGAVQKALEFFDQAIKKDPSFALSHVGLADSYNTLAGWESGMMAPEVTLPLVRKAASQALKIDPNLAEAHTSLAYAELHFGWNWRRAEEEFRRALRLNRNYADCHHWYSHYLTVLGKTRESLAESLRSIELDPLNLVMNVHLAWHYYMARQFGEALDQADSIAKMEPAFHWSYFFRGLALIQLKKFAEAIDAFRRAVKLSNGSTVMMSALGHAYGIAGDIANARGVLHTLNTMARRRYIASYEIAVIHTALNETDSAFAWLTKACSERSGWLPYLNVDPRIDSLRRDSRFRTLIKVLGLPTA
jgi:serine/threonine protein kinase/TolB-like protein/Tfp pilus assembly protein PilF